MSITWTQSGRREWTAGALCVRQVGVKTDERQYLAYAGPRYVGSHATLEEAQRAAEEEGVIT